MFSFKRKRAIEFLRENKDKKNLLEILKKEEEKGRYPLHEAVIEEQLGNRLSATYPIPVEYLKKEFLKLTIPNEELLKLNLKHTKYPLPTSKVGALGEITGNQSFLLLLARVGMLKHVPTEEIELEELFKRHKCWAIMKIVSGNKPKLVKEQEGDSCAGNYVGWRNDIDWKQFSPRKAAKWKKEIEEVLNNELGNKKDGIEGLLKKIEKIEKIEKIREI